MSRRDLARRAVAEGIATALLLATVVGSGIMGERLAAGNVAIALLANSIATGAGLVALIITFGPISGAHMNPAVTVAESMLGRISRADAVAYVVVQITGAFAGVAAAHLMFEEPLFSWSRHERAGMAQAFSELVATFGLVGVVQGGGRRSPAALPFAIGAYIAAAYWFTASTSFANPAVTLARAASDTFAGILWSDVPPFLIAQIGAAVLAALLFQWMLPATPGDGAPNVERDHERS